MRRLGAGMALALAAAGCTASVRGRPTLAVVPVSTGWHLLHDHGTPVEAEVLAVYPGRWKPPNPDVPAAAVQWAEVALRNRGTSLVKVSRPAVSLVDAAGRKDDRSALPMTVQVGDGDPNHPALESVTVLGPGETVVGEAPITPPAAGFRARTVRLGLTDAADWSLDRLPKRRVDRPVVAPDTAELGNAVTLVGTGATNAPDSRPTTGASRVTVTVLGRVDLQSDQSDAGWRLIGLAVRIANAGEHPYQVAARYSMVGFDAFGRPVTTGPVDGSDKFWYGTVVPPAAARTFDLALYVPTHAPLSHVRFALDNGTATAVAWWTLS